MRILRNFLAVIILTTVCAEVEAQQNLWRNDNFVSPEVHTDGSVTLRLYAPEAESVAVVGDFVGGEAQLTKCESGVWEYHFEPLASELYSYSFVVDGMRDVRDPMNVYAMRDVGSLFNYFIVGGQRGDLYSAQDVPHGTLSRVWATMDDGRERRMTIYTPAGYEQSRRSYPTLYLLHGMGGDEEAWVATGRVCEIMDNLIAQRKAEPMVVVMTNGCTKHCSAPGYSHEGMWRPYMSGSMDGSFEAMFPTIVRWVEQNYNVKCRREARAIAGLSMGGFHSMQISKEYPEMFGYVGLFSAAIFRGDSNVAIYNDLESKLAKQFAVEPYLYWIAIGKEDFLYGENVAYRELLDKAGYSYTYRESEGGHTWRNWRVYLSEFAPQLFKAKK